MISLLNRMEQRKRREHYSRKSEQTVKLGETSLFSSQMYSETYFIILNFFVAARHNIIGHHILSKHLSHIPVAPCFSHINFVRHAAQVKSKVY